MRVEVSTPGRLHLGDLDPFALGRFGYAPILAIDKPRTVVEAEDAETLTVQGLEAEEARAYARRVMETFHLKGVKLTVKSTAPRHSGLGSTTQLCLAVGRAVTKAHGIDLPLSELVKSLKRTSTGGLFTFQLGGFVVAGGFPVKPGEKVLLRSEPLIPPLIFHSDFPEDWRFVMVHPFKAPRSPDGEEEEVYQLHEFGIIYHPNRPFLVGIMVRGDDFNKLMKVIRDITRIVYEEVDQQS